MIGLTVVQHPHRIVILLLRADVQGRNRDVAKGQSHATLTCHGRKRSPLSPVDTERLQLFALQGVVPADNRIDTRQCDNRYRAEPGDELRHAAVVIGMAVGDDDGKQALAERIDLIAERATAARVRRASTTTSPDLPSMRYALANTSSAPPGMRCTRGAYAGAAAHAMDAQTAPTTASS